MGTSVTAGPCPQGGNHAPTHNGNRVVCDKCGNVLKDG
jgi:hypothetical protein